jgi:hypothetical protein
MRGPIEIVACVLCAVAVAFLGVTGVFVGGGWCRAGGGSRGVGGAAAAAQVPRAGEYTCQLDTDIMSVYCEDATDRGGTAVYDRDAIRRLKWFTFDITDNALYRVKTTLAMLDGAATRIIAQPDMTSSDILGDHTATPQQSGANLLATMKDGITVHGTKYDCGDLWQKLERILFEREGSRYGILLTAYDNDYANLLSQWQQYFPNLKEFCVFATNPGEMTDPKGVNVWLEAYNLYNMDHTQTGPGVVTCNHCHKDIKPADCPGGCAKNPNCRLDFDSSEKPPCVGDLEFQGAVCGPHNTPCKLSACGADGCKTHVTCDKTYNYGGNIYDPATPFTLYERGAFVGRILAEFYGPTPIPLPANRWIFFPFTTASCPTLRAVIQTPADFARFVAGFQDSLVEGKTFTRLEVMGLTFGAWGVPDWLLGQA